MGASCPWGGYTDRIVCNIHGEEPKIMSIGPLAAAGEVVLYERTHRITDHYYGCVHFE